MSWEIGSEAGLAGQYLSGIGGITFLAGRSRCGPGGHEHGHGMVGVYKRIGSYSETEVRKGVVHDY
jgi:hypothetical protein